MASALVKKIQLARRWLLQNLVPEFLWPRQVNIDGVIIKVRHAPYTFGTRYILTTGKYEMPERKLLTNIKAGQVVFEMGGSIGVVTAILGKMVGESGKVYSVEASAALTSYSKTWLEKSGNIQVLTGFGFPVYECGNRIHVKSFDESPGALAGIVSFDMGVSERVNDVNNSPLYDLKTIADTFHVLPDVLVVDIEGSEKALLQDGMELPQSLQYVLMELHPRIYGEIVMQSILAKMEELDFSILASEANTYLFSNNKLVSKIK